MLVSWSHHKATQHVTITSRSWLTITTMMKPFSS